MMSGISDDEENLPSVKQLFCSSSDPKHALLERDVIALDTELEDPDLTQIPTGTKYYQQDLENLFNSDDGDKEEETKNEGSNYTDFMQSQLNLNLIDDPEENKKEAAFYHSDEELSELECFTSIQQLLAKGGDDRRRAEFILRQFQKTDEKSTGPKTTTKKRATPSAKSIGIRRLRK